MIKVILFDIDGTLLDSNDAHAQSFVRAFKRFGVTVSFVELKWLIGMGADRILEKFLDRRQIKNFGDELTEYRKDLFLRDHLPKLKKFPKIRELFKKLRADGLKIALASSASEEELEKYHQILRVDDLLDEETSSDDAEESKPAPDIFQAALAKLENVQKTEALVIGDTPYDAEAARRARIPMIGVRSGGWSRKKLLAEGCLEVYRDIAEILENYETIFPNKII